MHACIMFEDSAGYQGSNSVYNLLKAGQQALTLGLLRGLDERPVEAPLTERDLTDQRLKDYKKENRVSTRGLCKAKHIVQCNAVCTHIYICVCVYVHLSITHCTSGCVQLCPGPCEEV